MMTKWRDKSSHDIEVHRLKNRLRQQKYRARKREEKARAVGSTPLIADLFISSFPNVTNELHWSKHDMGSLNLSINAEDGIRSIESGYEDIGKSDSVYSPIEAEPVQATYNGNLEDQQEPEAHHIHSNGGSIGTDVVGDLDVSLRDFQSDQLLPGLEHGYVNTLQSECNSSPKPIDRIMARRLKNRERQRRYRARRRLEADMRRFPLIQESTPPTVELQHSGFTTNPETQVHCQRNWKEDARKARATKQPKFISTGPQSPVLHSEIEQQTHISPSEVKKVEVEPDFPSEHLVILNNCDTSDRICDERESKSNS